MILTGRLTFGWLALCGLMCSLVDVIVSEEIGDDRKSNEEDFRSAEQNGMLCEREGSVTAACLACAETGIIPNIEECCSSSVSFEICHQAIILSEENNDSTDGAGDRNSNDEIDESDDDDVGEDGEELSEDKRRSPFLGKRRNPFLGKRRNPFLGKRRSPFLGKRRSPFLGKRRSPFLGKRRSPFLGKRRSPFLGKRRSPFLGKRSDADLPEQFQFEPANDLRTPTKLISDRMLEKRSIRTE